MVTFYEVWDGGTGNRVGGTFASAAEAQAVLADVLRVNGEEAVSDMGIMACYPNAEGKVRRRMVLEGSAFVDHLRRASATSSVAGVGDVTDATRTVGAHGTTDVHEHRGSNRVVG